LKPASRINKFYSSDKKVRTQSIGKTTGTRRERGHVMSLFCIRATEILFSSRNLLRQKIPKWFPFSLLILEIPVAILCSESRIPHQVLRGSSSPTRQTAEEYFNVGHDKFLKRI
jgi:hypothetical protein